jgi:cytochrome c-type biogenesis protein CcmE
MTTSAPPPADAWLDDESTDAVGPAASHPERSDARSAAGVGVGVGDRSVTLTTRKGNNRRVLAFAAVLIAAIGFLVVKGLGTAATYFRTTDEAVAQVNSLGDRRFRIEGVVVEDSVRSVDNSVQFLIEGNGKQVLVRHEGDPPELFRPNLAVVLEGRFAPGQAGRTPGTAPRFESDHLMVKHDEN